MLTTETPTKYPASIIDYVSLLATDDASLDAYYVYSRRDTSDCLCATIAMTQIESVDGSYKSFSTDLWPTPLPFPRTPTR